MFGPIRMCVFVSEPFIYSAVFCRFFVVSGWGGISCENADCAFVPEWSDFNLIAYICSNA